MTAREQVVKHLERVYKTNDLLFVDYKPLPNHLSSDTLDTSFTRGSVRVGNGMVRTNSDVQQMIEEFVAQQD